MPANLGHVSHTVSGALVCGALLCLVVAGFCTTVALGFAALGCSLGALAFIGRQVASRG